MEGGRPQSAENVPTSLTLAIVVPLEVTEWKRRKNEAEAQPRAESPLTATPTQRRSGSPAHYCWQQRHQPGSGMVEPEWEEGLPVSCLFCKLGCGAHLPF